jgi:hypothetical protein
MARSLLNERQVENKQENKKNKTEQQSIYNQQYNAMAVLLL